MPFTAAAHRPVDMLLLSIRCEGVAPRSVQEWSGTKACFRSAVAPPSAFSGLHCNCNDRRMPSYHFKNRRRKPGHDHSVHNLADKTAAQIEASKLARSAARAAQRRECMDRQNVSKRDSPLLYAERLTWQFAVACAATVQVAALGLSRICSDVDGSPKYSTENQLDTICRAV